MSSNGTSMGPPVPGATTTLMTDDMPNILEAAAAAAAAAAAKKAAAAKAAAAKEAAAKEAAAKEAAERVRKYHERQSLIRPNRGTGDMGGKRKFRKQTKKSKKSIRKSRKMRRR